MELNNQQKLAIIDAITQFSPKVMFECDPKRLFDDDQFRETCDEIDDFVIQCKKILETYMVK